MIFINYDGIPARFSLSFFHCHSVSPLLWRAVSLRVPFICPTESPSPLVARDGIRGIFIFVSNEERILSSRLPWPEQPQAFGSHSPIDSTSRFRLLFFQHQEFQWPKRLLDANRRTETLTVAGPRNRPDARSPQ